MSFVNEMEYSTQEPAYDEFDLLVEVITHITQKKSMIFALSSPSVFFCVNFFMCTVKLDGRKRKSSLQILIISDYLQKSYIFDMIIIRNKTERKFLKIFSGPMPRIVIDQYL